MSNNRSSGDFISFIVGGIVVLLYFLWKRREKSSAAKSASQSAAGPNCGCVSGAQVVPLSNVPDNDGNSGRYIGHFASYNAPSNN